MLRDSNVFEACLLRKCLFFQSGLKLFIFIQRTSFFWVGKIVVYHALQKNLDFDVQKYKLLELLSWVLFDRKNITYLSTCSHTSEKMRNIDAHCFYAFFWGWDKNENTLWHLATLPIDICKPHYDQHNFSPFRNGNFPIMNPIIRIGIRILNLFWA